MSAFSTVGNVFTDPEFAARGKCLLVGHLWSLDETRKDRTGFLIMPQRPHT